PLRGGLFLVLHAEFLALREQQFVEPRKRLQPVVDADIDFAILRLRRKDCRVVVGARGSKRQREQRRREKDGYVSQFIPPRRANARGATRACAANLPLLPRSPYRAEKSPRSRLFSARRNPAAARRRRPRS